MITFKKIPIIKTGMMVYFKEDPDKTPYKWRYWDHSEKEANNEIGFCNKKDAKYKYVIEFKWRITF